MVVLPGVQPFAWGIVTLGAALLVAAVLMDFRRVRGALSSRRGRFGLGSAVRICLVCGIVILVNVAGTTISGRVDVTGLAQFTLTSQTKDVLSNLETPVDVVQVFTPRVPAGIRGYARNLLREYGVHTDKLAVTEIDPDVSPDLARQYGVDRLAATYGVVLFRSGGHQKMVYGPQIIGEAEHAFTSALLEVTGTRQKTVYFLTGDEGSQVAGDFSEAVSGLRDNLFRVAELDLATTSAVPGDAAALIIAGRVSELPPNHEAVLSSYLRDSGRALVLLDPNPVTGTAALTAAVGIEVANGILVDPRPSSRPSRTRCWFPSQRNGWALPRAISRCGGPDPFGGTARGLTVSPRLDERRRGDSRNSVETDPVGRRVRRRSPTPLECWSLTRHGGNRNRRTERASPSSATRILPETSTSRMAATPVSS